MALLPSGTSISAADINTYLGRSSSTAVDWNTTVRTLASNTNGTVDMNTIRGRGSRGLYHSTGQTADVSINSSYFSCFTQAFSIPGTPWRLIARGFPANSNGSNALELTITGTGYRTRYIYRNTGSALPITHPNFPVYPGADYNMAMLSNGKFVIAYSIANLPGYFSGSYGLGFTVLTFNTDGSIASTNNYYTKLGSSLTGSYGSDSYVLANRLQNREMTTWGNSCALVLNTAGQKWLTVRFDGSSSSPVIQYTVVSNQNTSGTSYVSSYNIYGLLHSVIFSDGSISVMRAPQGLGEAVLSAKLNAAGNAWTNPGTRWGSSATAGYKPFYPLESLNYSGGYQFNLDETGDGTGSVDNAIFIDNSLSHNIRNYFIIRSYGGTCANFQSQGSPYNSKYFTGHISGLLIQKVNADTNAIKHSWILVNEGPYIYNDVYDSKTGSTTRTFYGPQTMTARGVMAVRTDSSDNTYYIIRTTWYGNGGTYTTPAPLYNGAVPVPETHMTYYTLYKINSSGQKVWQRDFDIGPKGFARNAFVSPPIANDYGDLGSNRATWSILIREEIDTVEVYATYGVAPASATNPFSFNPSEFKSRSGQFSTIDGSSYTNTDAANSLGTFVNNGTLYNIIGTSGSSQNITPKLTYQTSVSNVTATSNSSSYTSSSSWSETLSANSTTAFFALNPTTPLVTGTAYTEYSSF